MVLPDPPEYLSAAARGPFERLARALYEMGVMTNSAVTMLGELCETLARLAQVRRELGAKKKLEVKGSQGPMVSPLLKVEIELQKQVFAHAREFGLSPSSRSLVEVIAKPSDFGPVDEAMYG